MIQTMRTLLLIAVILLSGFGAHADIYKYEAEDGTIYFTNSPLNAKGKVIVKEGRRSTKHDKDNPQKDNEQQSAPYSRGSYRSIAEDKALQYNIDPQLIKAVIRVESNWNPYAVSPKGALGLMQLMPSTAVLLGVVNPFDPVENIDGGVRYLKYLIEKFGGSLTLALAAYNAGPKLVEKRGGVPSIPETVAYVKKVLAYYSGGAGFALNVTPREIQREIKREFSRIKKLMLEDGTMLFTNSYLAHSYLDK